MCSKFHSVQPDELTTHGGWRIMARRRRGQFPEPKQENGQWKIRYWIDQVHDNGHRARVRKTKCLGSIEDLTATQARKEGARFLQPINDLEQGFEYSATTMRHLITRWCDAVKPALKLSTQLSYEWAFKRINVRLARRPSGPSARLISRVS